MVSHGSDRAHWPFVTKSHKSLAAPVPTHCAEVQASGSAGTTERGL
jgi:hypothetical protein